MIPLHRFTSILLIASAGLAHAQMGIRFSPLHYESVEVGSNWHFTAGFDIDMSQRTAMTIEYSSRLDIWGTTATNVEEFDIAGYFISISPNTRTWSLALRSLYFLSDGTSGGYLATSIGYRAIELELDPNFIASSGSNYDAPSWVRRSSHQGGYTQLGLRLGVRSELDGFYGDLFVGLGMNLGDPDLDLPVYMSGSEWGIRKLYLQAGYAMGIGW